MPKRICARELLRTATLVFDEPGAALANNVGNAWRGGFAGGGAWMKMAMSRLRGQEIEKSRSDLQRLGCIKYAMASGAACVVLAVGLSLHSRVISLTSVVAFYAIEAQMVFLFPLALDGSAKPLRESRQWTRRAGGTIAVMRVVIPLAATMLLGGFMGRGFVRSWCLGCIAVCAWYEALRCTTR